MNDRPPVLLERHQRIATVMLNNRDRLNALTRAMWDALAERMAEVDADPDLRAVILRGAGQRAFAAGADISEFATDGAPLGARWHKKFARRLAETEPLTAVEYDESFACFGTEDFRVGHQAFLSKTKPEFKGL